MAELINDPLQGARLILMLRQQGITDSDVLGAIEKVPRSDFVGPALADLAFEDCVLPIDCGQTLARPSEIAPMLQALKLYKTLQARVLVVGAGSGYVLAVLAAMGADVFGVERYGQLTRATEENIQNQGLGSIHLKHGDGLEGWPDQGPFDRILLMGGVLSVPEVLLQQLRSDGFCVAPVCEAEDDVWKQVSMGADGQTLESHPIGMQIALSHGVSKAL